MVMTASGLAFAAMLAAVFGLRIIRALLEARRELAEERKARDAERPGGVG